MPYPFYLKDKTVINTRYIQEITNIHQSEYYLNDAKTPTPIWIYYITMTNGKQYTEIYESKYDAETNRAELIGLLREPVV